MMRKHTLLSADEKEKFFSAGVQFFNKGQFFESHEEWEHIWLKEEGALKPFYQGLIQVAAGFHHAQKKNLRPAINCLEKGITKLEPFQKALEKFLKQVKESLELLKKGKSLTFPIIDNTDYPPPDDPSHRK